MKNYILFVALFACSILRGQTVFRHTTAANNTSGHITTLDHPQLNGNPNALIFTMTVYNKNGTETTGIDYANNTGVWYNGSKWTIFNQNTKLPMPQGLTFNVLIAPTGNPNVFNHLCTAKNTGSSGGTFGNGSWIDNIATNDNPNALLLVTQNWKGYYNDNTPVVSYGGGKWHISNTISSPNDLGVKLEKNMPVGASFNVMVINKGQVPGFSDALGFMHTATKTNISIPQFPNVTFIDNQSFKHSKDILVFATQNWGWGNSGSAEQTAGPYNDSPISAWFNTYFTNGNAIYNPKANAPMPVGSKFNVVAIGAKPSEPIKPITGVEIFAPEVTKRDTASLLITLPFQKTPQLLRVEVISGYIIIENDIVLGLESEYFNRINGKLVQKKDVRNKIAATPDPNRLWVNGIIPYEIQVGHPQRAAILAAINIINQRTNICLRPRNGEADYASFVNTTGGCWARLGRQGGMQVININGCSSGSIQHEILHTAGIFHEHSRFDRDNFITINWANLQQDRTTLFQYRIENNSIGACGYDFGSIMHYPQFNRDAINLSLPTFNFVRPVPDGVTVGQRSALSDCDIAGIQGLYPTAIGCNAPPPQNSILTIFQNTGYQGQSAGFNTSRENVRLPFTSPNYSMQLQAGYVAWITFYCDAEFPTKIRYLAEQSSINFPTQTMCKIEIVPANQYSGRRLRIRTKCGADDLRGYNTAHFQVNFRNGTSLSPILLHRGLAGGQSAVQEFDLGNNVLLTDIASVSIIHNGSPNNNPFDGGDLFHTYDNWNLELLQIDLILDNNSTQNIFDSNRHLPNLQPVKNWENREWRFTGDRRNMIFNTQTLDW